MGRADIIQSKHLEEELREIYKLYYESMEKKRETMEKIDEILSKLEKIDETTSLIKKIEEITSLLKKLKKELK